MGPLSPDRAFCRGRSNVSQPIVAAILPRKACVDRAEASANYFSRFALSWHTQVLAPLFPPTAGPGTPKEEGNFSAMHLRPRRPEARTLRPRCDSRAWDGLLDYPIHSTFRRWPRVLVGEYPQLLSQM